MSDRSIPLPEWKPCGRCDVLRTDLATAGKRICELVGEVEALRASLSAAERRVGELEKALRTIEWACRDDFDEPYCSVCGSGRGEWPPKGHLPGCQIRAALAAREGT